jgi:hypothetical protein
MNQTEKLQSYEVSLENATNQIAIAQLLAAAGYSATVIDLGKDLLLEAKSVVSFSTTSYKQFRDAERLFIDKKAAYRKHFTDHRKRINILFREDASKKDALFLKGVVPYKYSEWYDMAEKFYSAINANEDIKTALATIGITQNHLDEANTLASELKAAEFEKFRLKAVSEDATTQKKEAVTAINKWMRDFYDMAKIALKDRPQLLEALNKVVRS